jgi:hypothetical protein
VVSGRLRGGGIGAGSTPPGQGWLDYNNTAGLHIVVDTSAAGFTTTPVYVASVAGDGSHWILTGTSAVYTPTATRFDMYIRFWDGRAITPADAANNNWRVSWIAIQT